MIKILQNKSTEINRVFAELIQRLKRFSAMVRLECKWKVIGELLLPEPDLPECFGYHTGKFCSCVKKKCCKEALCIENDSQKLAKLLRERHSGFLNVCHAGGCEIIVPIGENQTELVGCLMIGPFRRPGQHAVYAETEEEFQRLPVLDEAMPDAFSALLPEIFTPIITRIYQEPTRSLKEIPRDVRLQQILKVLREEPRRTPQELAGMVNLSPSRLFHLFRKECGVSLGEYLLRYRLWVARRYLQSNHWTICRIALHTGFSDQSHFTMNFRKFYGITPAKYRKRNCEERM